MSIRKRVLCLFLILLFLPSGVFVYAQNGSPGVTDYTAVNLTTGEEIPFKAVYRSGNYYIELNESRKLTGLRASVDGWYISFKGSAKQYRFKLDRSQHFTDNNGNAYYILDEILDKAKVQYSVNKQGKLCYVPALSNYDRLIAQGLALMSDLSINADIWEGNDGMGDAAFAVASTYDILSGLRFDAMWGKALYDDYCKLFLSILKPDTQGTNWADKLYKANKKTSVYVNALLEAQSFTEEVSQIWTELPPGSSILLFGIDGSEALRTVLDNYQAVNKVNFCDETLAAFMGYYGMDSYKRVMAEEGGKAMSSHGKLGFSDLLRVAGHMTNVVNASQDYTEALDNVMAWYATSEDYNQVFRLCGNKVVDEVRTAYKSKLGYIVTEVTPSILVDSWSNGEKSAISKTVFASGTVWISLEKEILESLLGMSTKTGLVIDLRRLSDIQEIFRSCFLQLTETQPSLEDAELIYDSVLLYLKICQMTKGYFKKVDMWTAPLENRFSMYEGVFSEFSLIDFKFSGSQPLKEGDLIPIKATTEPKPAQSLSLPEDYEEFLRSGDWVTDLQWADVSLIDITEMPSYYCLTDVDRDNTPELIILFNGYWIIYTRINGWLKYICSGAMVRDMDVQVCPDLGVVRFCGAYTSWSFNTFVRIQKGKELNRFEYEKEDPYYQGFSSSELDPILAGTYYRLKQEQIVGLEPFA